MKHVVIKVLLAMAGVALGSGVFYCLFLLGIETGWLLFIFQELDIRPRDRITLGSFKVGRGGPLQQLEGFLAW